MKQITVAAAIPKVLRRQLWGWNSLLCKHGTQSWQERESVGIETEDQSTCRNHASRYELGEAFQAFGSFQLTSLDSNLVTESEMLLH